MSKYFWRCPECGIQLEFRKRVTQRRRTCSHCGTAVTTEEIDKQSAQALLSKFLGLLFVGAVVVGFATFGSFQKNSEADSSSNNSTTPPAQSATGNESAIQSEALNNQQAKSVRENLDSNQQTTQTLSNASETQSNGSDDSSVAILPSDETVSIESNSNWAAEPAQESVQKIEKLITLVADGEELEVANILDEMTAVTPSNVQSSAEATQLNKSGLKALKLKQFSEASSSFARAIQIDSGDPKLFSNLGFAQTYDGNLESAKRNLYQSIALAPAREVAWDDLGQVFAKLHEQQKAVACFLIGFRLSDGRTLDYLKSLDRDDDVAVRLAGSLALQKATSDRQDGGNLH